MRNIRFFLTIFLLASAAIMLLGAADAKTIIVDDDWAGADYNSISDAVSAAKQGDTVRVYDGIYAGSVLVDKSIDIVGNGTSSTIFDGLGVNGNGRLDHQFGFHLMADGINFSGFQFRNCNPTHEFGPIGVYSSFNRIFDNLFYDNLNGINLAAGNNIVFNNSFIKNYYGIRSDERADNCALSFNYFTESTMGAVLYGKANNISFFSNVFEDQPRNGLAFYQVNDVIVTYNMFHSNSYLSTSRQALMVYKADGADIQNNTFVNNSRSIYVTLSKDVKIFDNTISDGLVGIMLPNAHANVWARNNNIFNNSEAGVTAQYFLGNRSDATMNWWGDISGPYHYVNNTGGKGNNVTDDLDFNPWLGMLVDLDPVAIINSVEPFHVNEGEPIEFRGRALARNWTTERIWSSSIDGVIYNGTDVVFVLDDLSPGTHTITLKVRDEFGEWSKEVFTTVVVNGRPVASIVSISPPLVNEGEEVTFIGKAIDLENDIRYVEWVSDIDGVLSLATEFKTTELSNGTHVITLSVMDGHKFWSAVVTGEVIVNGVPRAHIDGIEHPLVNEGEPVIFRGSSIDHEDGTIEFWWDSDVDGYLSDQTMFHTSSLSNGTHIITFRVLDDFQVWSVNATATVTVNGIPRAVIGSISPNPVTEGEEASFIGEFADHEDTILAYEWISDLQGDLSFSKDFTTSDLMAGVHMITFRVLDGNKVWSQWNTSTLLVNGRPMSWIDSEIPGVFNEGDTVHLDGGFSDPEGDIRGYLWESDIDGVIGTARNLTSSALSNGTHIISFRVMDGPGALSQKATISLTVNGIPRGNIIAIEPSSAQEGEVIKFTGEYVDHEDHISFIEWTSDVDGLLSEDLLFSTVRLTNGTHVITFRVMDGNGVWSETDIGSVEVNGRPRAWIESVGPDGMMEGQTVYFAGKAVDDLAVVAYRWSSSIDGIISDISIFSSSDLSPGDHDITFLAQDNDGIWSEPLTESLSIEGIELQVEIVAIDVPSSTLEGYEVTFGCTLGNPGNVPLLGLTVRFSIGVAIVGKVDLGRPVHPGSRVSVETTWIAQLGQHLVLIEVIHDGSVISSAFSEVTLDVDKVPVDDDDTPGPIVTDRTDDEDGLDSMITVLLMVAFAVVIATAYLLWSNERSDRREKAD
jgi:parallel beta-helix repeat protein